MNKNKSNECFELFRDSALKRLNLTYKDWAKALKLFCLFDSKMESLYGKKWSRKFRFADSQEELRVYYSPYVEALLGRSEDELNQVIHCIKHDKQFSVFPPNSNQLIFLFECIEEKQHDTIHKPFEPLKSRRDND